MTTTQEPTTVPATDRNRLGGVLREKRESFGWSLAYMSETYGIDKGALSRVETGDRTPSLDTLHRLRDAYGVPDREWLVWIDLLKPERQHHGSAV